MGEIFNVDWSGKDLERTVEPLVSRDEVVGLIAGVESRANRDNLNSLLEQASALLNPIFVRIDNLPAGERESFLAGHSNMQGPAYEALRCHYRSVDA